MYSESKNEENLRKLAVLSLNRHIVQVFILNRGRPKAVFVFGTEDRRLMKPSVPKITEDCRRPKTEGYNRRSLTFKSGIT